MMGVVGCKGRQRGGAGCPQVTQVGGEALPDIPLHTLDFTLYLLDGQLSNFN